MMIHNPSNGRGQETHEREERRETHGHYTQFGAHPYYVDYLPRRLWHGENYNFLGTDGILAPNIDDISGSHYVSFMLKGNTVRHRSTDIYGGHITRAGGNVFHISKCNVYVTQDTPTSPSNPIPPSSRQGSQENLTASASASVSSLLTTKNLSWLIVFGGIAIVSPLVWAWKKA